MTTLTTAQCCENCVFSGFKASYMGSKRITGLCLHYQSEPRINYHFKPDNNFPYLLEWFHEELRRQKPDEFNPASFEDVIHRVPENTTIVTVWVNYLVQKGRNAEKPEARPYSHYHSLINQGLPVGILWTEELPDNLTRDDWPRIVVHYGKKGGHVNYYRAYRREPVMNLDGQTNEEIVALLRPHYDNITRYHQGWRDYFANAQIQKIKRTTVCENHQPMKKRPRYNTTEVTPDVTPGK